MDAGELRVKESNRINTVSETLVAYGADVKPTPDGFLITGVSRLQAPAESLSNHGDHRIAMLQSIAQLLTSNDAPIADQAAIAVSYPDFETRYGGANACLKLQFGDWVRWEQR